MSFFHALLFFFNYDFSHGIFSYFFCLLFVHIAGVVPTGNSTGKLTGKAPAELNEPTGIDPKPAFATAIALKTFDFLSTPMPGNIAEPLGVVRKAPKRSRRRPKELKAPPPGECFRVWCWCLCMLHAEVMRNLCIMLPPPRRRGRGKVVIVFYAIFFSCILLCMLMLWCWNVFYM